MRNPVRNLNTVCPSIQNLMTTVQPVPLNCRSTSCSIQHVLLNRIAYHDESLCSWQSNYACISIAHRMGLQPEGKKQPRVHDCQLNIAPGHELGSGSFWDGSQCRLVRGFPVGVGWVGVDTSLGSGLGVPVWSNRMNVVSR
jgi:hypothetical protein